ncbi:MAG: hypothetical protein JO240_06060 [Solirubrobacterales bacterium]|nr:hypothetical protein [Solirubrobacterales bacterium]
MAEEETPDDECRLGDVQITIVVVPGWIRARLTKFTAGARVRAGLASFGLIAAVAAGAVIAVSSSTGRAGRRVESGTLATRFAPRSNCARLTVVSTDGAYARIDLDRAGPCGTFGNQATLILHRLHGVWLREFEASSWTCPMRRLPQPVAIELRLCHSSRGATPPGAPDKGA